MSWQEQAQFARPWSAPSLIVVSRQGNIAAGTGAIYDDVSEDQGTSPG